jgi:hypothetical protein
MAMTESSISLADLMPHGKQLRTGSVRMHGMVTGGHMKILPG